MAKVDSIGFVPQVDVVLDGEVAEGEQPLEVVGDLCRRVSSLSTAVPSSPPRACGRRQVVPCSELGIMPRCFKAHSRSSHDCVRRPARPPAPRCRPGGCLPAPGRRGGSSFDAYVEVQAVGPEIDMVRAGVCCVAASAHAWPVGPRSAAARSQLSPASESKKAPSAGSKSQVNSPCR